MQFYFPRGAQYIEGSLFKATGRGDRGSGGYERKLVYFERFHGDVQDAKKRMIFSSLSYDFLNRDLTDYAKKTFKPRY